MNRFDPLKPCKKHLSYYQEFAQDDTGKITGTYCDGCAEEYEPAHEYTQRELDEIYLGEQADRDNKIEKETGIK